MLHQMLGERAEKSNTPSSHKTGEIHCGSKFPTLGPSLNRRPYNKFTARTRFLKTHMPSSRP